MLHEGVQLESLTPKETFQENMHVHVRRYTQSQRKHQVQVHRWKETLLDVMLDAV